MVEHGDQSHEGFNSDLIEGYLSGQLSTDQVAAFERMMRTDPQARHDYIQALEIMSMVRDEFRGRQEQGELHASEPLLGDFDQLLSELGQAERKAEALPIQIDHATAPKPSIDIEKLSKKEIVGVLLYLGRRPKVWGPIAAVLALALTLTVVLINGLRAPESLTNTGGTHPNEMERIVTTEIPEPSVTDPIVATLTAERGAAWDIESGGPLRPGTALASGQRLTLTHGFAEITTLSGAKAMLEAPCSVELLDTGDGFRLYRGTVACLVQSERAKGFRVLTNRLEVTDFGTTFGVDASDPGAVQVHVYEGEVQVVRSSLDDLIEPTSKQLYAGDAVVETAGAEGLTEIDADPERFVATSSTVVKLPGTGFGLSDQAEDRSWSVVAIDGVDLPSPIYWRVSDHPGAVGVSHDPESAQWIAHPVVPVIPEGQASQSYLIRTEIQLPQDLDINRSRILVRFSADNEVGSIRVNGQRVSVPPVNIGPEIDLYLSHMVIDQHLLQGSNTIEFEVINRAFGNVPSGDVSIYVAWDLHIDPYWPPLSDDAGETKTGTRKEDASAF